MTSQKAVRKTGEAVPSTTLARVAEALWPVLAPISRMHEDPKNAAAHDEANAARVRGSLGDFRQAKPVVTRTCDSTCTTFQGSGELVVAGTLPFRSAVELGLTHVARSRVDHLSPAEARAYGVADNASSQGRTWDEDRLSDVVRALRDEGGGLELKLGLDDAALKWCLAKDDESRAALERDDEAVLAANARVVGGFQFQVVVDVGDEAGQVALMTELEGRGLRCRPSMS